MTKGSAHYTSKAFAWYCLLCGVFVAGYTMTASTLDLRNFPDLLLHLEVMRLPFLLACIGLGYALHLLTGSSFGLAAALGFASLIGAQVAALWVPSSPWATPADFPVPRLADVAGVVVSVGLLAGVLLLSRRDGPMNRPRLFLFTLAALAAGSLTLLGLQMAESVLSAGGHNPPPPHLTPVVVIAWTGGAALLAIWNLRSERSGVAAGTVCYLLLMLCGLVLWLFMDSAPYFLASTYRVVELCALGAVPFGFCIDALLALRRTQLHWRTEQDPAQRDSLTGLFNRRALETLGASVFDDCLAGGRPVSLLMMDLDHFKRVNDLYGHATGDEVLKQFAEILRSTVRATDLVARYGGEEFVAILPGSALGSAMQLGERIRSNTEAGDFKIGSMETRQTVSIGAVTAFPGESGHFRAMLERADRNLYRAKREGRNRICTSSLEETEEA